MMVMTVGRRRFAYIIVRGCGQDERKMDARSRPRRCCNNVKRWTQSCNI